MIVQLEIWFGSVSILQERKSTGHSGASSGAAEI